MPKYICKLNNGKTKEVFPICNIGDYVEVVDPGHQYTTYQDAFDYFWGGAAPYKIPYDDPCAPKVWKVINMVCHCDRDAVILYHIRTVDGKNALVNRGAIRPLHRHERNRMHVHDIMIYQLPSMPYLRSKEKCEENSSMLDDDGNIIKHDWKEKLYEILG